MTSRSPSSTRNKKKSVTDAMSDITITELPTVRDLQFVNSDKFSSKKVNIGDEVETGSFTRASITYKYSTGVRDLCLTTPRDILLSSNGVEEEMFTNKKGTKTPTGKNIMKFFLDLDNPEHEKFYKAIMDVETVVDKKIKELTEDGNMTATIRGVYDLKDDRKKVTGHVICARLIESGDGIVYSVAYDDEIQMDIKKIGRCTARPGLTFSYLAPDVNKTDYKINISVAQTYVVHKSLFPLRDRE